MTDADRLEELYDTYLDRLLAGVEVDPEAFLEREGCQNIELLEKLKSLHLAARLVPSANPTTDSPCDADLPCERIAGYQLLKRLGQGGMGEVFLAEQETLGRQVALKILHESSFPTPNASLRFHREARSLAKLRHPHVVTVFDFGAEDGLHYLVMEFIPGQDLSKTILDAKAQKEAIPPSTAVRWAAQIARALEAVHQVNILHRDVKPSNIRITPEGRAVLVGFGLVTTPSADGPTLTSSFLGTPSYASPEQVSGQSQLDARSDIFSLGTTLYRCITGRLPFEGKELEQLFHQILTVEAEAPKRIFPGIPRDLDVVIRHAMEKKPERRYASAEAFAADLEALLEFRPIMAQPPSRARRLRFWMRQHRASSAAALTGAAAVFTMLIFFTMQSLQEDRERAQNAQRLVAEARVRFGEFLSIRNEIEHDSTQVNVLTSGLESTYLEPSALALLDQMEDAVLESELKRERLFNGVLDLLDQAEALGTDVADANALRAELYLSRHLESEGRGDSVGSRFYKAQAGRFVDASSTLKTMQPEYILDLHISPPGPTRIAPFTHQEQSQLQAGGDHRMVPTLHGQSPSDLTPGTWCLRLSQAHEGLPAGSLLFEVQDFPVESTVLVSKGNGMIMVGHRLLTVDGQPIKGGFEMDQVLANQAVDGNPNTRVPAVREFIFHDGAKKIALQSTSLRALGLSLALPQDFLREHPAKVRLFDDGEIRQLHLSAGCETVVNTAPLFTQKSGWQEYFGSEFSVPVPSTSSVLLIQRAGFENVILPLRPMGTKALSYSINLMPTASTPKGYRQIHPGPFWELERFWMMEREITSEEYMEFLNSPEAQERMQLAQQPVLFPRTFRNANSGGLWIRQENGLFQLPADWNPMLPVLAVSWFDAKAFADWKTQQAKAEGLPYKFRLPSLREFRVAARGTANWDDPYGPRFRPHWSNCCFSRPTPAAEPVMRFGVA